jgi:hypothetical protein
MELLNATSMQAAYTMGTDPSAREHVVVVVKGTFAIPDDGGPAEQLPKEQQVPLAMADTFTGEPGFSAPVHEAEFCLRKPRCDVLVNGTAYVPEGKPVERIKVGVKLGSWQKDFDVVGDRVWQQRGVTPHPSAPRPFVTMPVTYDRAFGGVDDTNPEHASAFMQNPVGRGYGAPRSAERLLGRPVCNTEDPRDPVKLPWGSYRPMSLGPVARGWQPRLAYAGTYDQNWLDNIFPFLPPDFDDRHFQAAPEDQQVDPPRPGEEVILLNLTTQGRTHFRLPTDLEMPVAFFPRQGDIEHRHGTLDTVLIEPGDGRLCLVWRCSRPLRRNIFELNEIVAGRMGRGWWRAKETGKPYYASLDRLLREARGRRVERAA